MRKVVATANLRHSFTTLIDSMYVLWTSRCRIKIGVERIYFQAKQIIFECATLRILRSSINFFVWTKKKTVRALCSAHGCKSGIIEGMGGSQAKRNSQNGRRQSYHHEEELQVGKDLLVIRRYNRRHLRPLHPGTYQASGFIIPVTNRHRGSLWASWRMDQHGPHPSQTDAACTCTALPC